MPDESTDDWELMRQVYAEHGVRILPDAGFTLIDGHELKIPSSMRVTITNGVPAIDPESAAHFAENGTAGTERVNQILERANRDYRERLARKTKT